MTESSESSFGDALQRMTGRMNQVVLANALVRKGQFAQALQLLRNVRDAYDEPAMVKQIEVLISDVEARAGVRSAPAAPPPSVAPARTETRPTPRPAPGSPAKPKASSALARARSDLASAEETIARARAAVERSVQEGEREREREREAGAGGAPPGP